MSQPIKVDDLALAQARLEKIQEFGANHSVLKVSAVGVEVYTTCAQSGYARCRLVSYEELEKTIVPVADFLVAVGVMSTLDLEK